MHAENGAGRPGLEEAVEALASAGISRAGLLVVLGSGQRSPWQDRVRVALPYEEVPGWEKPGVEGHGGCLSMFSEAGENVLVMAGRHHYYESRSYDGVLRPLETARALGVRLVLLTNSAGALDPTLQAGDLVLVDDHIFMQGPDLPGRLQGVRPSGRRNGYSPRGRRIVREAARKSGVELSGGTLLCVTGPAYETAAEAAMGRRAGARVAAMSLAPEALAAWTMEMEVTGISLVTNVIGAAREDAVDHAEVVEAASRAQPRLARLLREALPMLLV
ncbi:MAG: purine-nucleoside phosphorylase [bacterium]